MNPYIAEENAALVAAHMKAVEELYQVLRQSLVENKGAFEESAGERFSRELIMARKAYELAVSRL